MTEKARTTIVLPREVLRRAKLRSVEEDQTLSDFIASALDRVLGATGEPIVPELPIGKYAWGATVPSRKEI